MRKLLGLVVMFAAVMTGQTDVPGHLTVAPDQTNNLDACVKLMSLSGGNTAGICAPASLAGAYTVVMPGSNSAGVLTNDGSGNLTWGAGGSSQPFSDNVALLKDSADATKLALFEAGSITTATTRTYTLPDVDMVLAGRDVDNTFSAIQTFSGRINVGTSGASGPGIRDNAGVLECSDDGSTWLACGPSSVTNYWGRAGTTITTATVGDVLKLDSHLLFSAPSASDIGDATNYFQTAYGENLDLAPPGVTGNYANIRKLNIYDLNGGTSFWDFQVSRSGSATSYYVIRDNAGVETLRLDRVVASATVDNGVVDLNWVPKTDNQRSLGATGLDWLHINFDGNLIHNGNTVINSSRQWALSSFLFSSDGSQSIGAASANRPGAVHVSGAGGGVMVYNGSVLRMLVTPPYLSLYNNSSTEVIRLDSNTGGAIFTGAITVAGCTGCGSGSLPVVDTNSIVEGSSDATKELRIEVDGFTTGTTRVWTAPNANITVAGINLAQTWTTLQTYNAGIHLDTAGGPVSFSNATGLKLMLFDGGATSKYGMSIAASQFQIHRAYSTDKLSFGYGSSGGYTEQAYINGTYFDIGNLWLSGSASARIAVANTMLPTVTNSYDLGSYGLGLYWKDLALRGIAVFSDGVNTGGVRMSGGVLQCSNNLFAWVACGGSSSLPVADTTGIVHGSSDATKILRFEVDSISSGVTRVLTVPNVDITIAGTNAAQTWAATQTFQKLLFSVDNAYTIGDSTANRPSSIYAATSMEVYGGSVARVVIGNNFTSWRDGFSTTKAIVDSSTGHIYTWGSFFSSGVQGVSITSTVRDAAGTGTCTMIFSGGIRTGGTC